MAYWTCSKCGEELHDAYVVCWKCTAPRPDQLGAAEDPSGSTTEPELTLRERWRAWAGVWGIFLFLTSFSHRGDLVWALPVSLLFFPVGLVALFQPQSNAATGTGVIMAWLGYATLTMVAVSTTNRKSFNMLLLVFVFFLTLNMAGCYRMVR